MTEPLSNQARTMTLVLTALFVVVGVAAGAWIFYATV